MKCICEVTQADAGPVVAGQAQANSIDQKTGAQPGSQSGRKKRSSAKKTKQGDYQLNNSNYKEHILKSQPG